ncbi:hypothetical protein COBT_003636, partial [Conglomerata obtusa]
IIKYGTYDGSTYKSDKAKNHDIIPIQETRDNRKEHFPNYAKTDIEKGSKRDSRKFQPGDDVLVFKGSESKMGSKWHDGFY